MAITKKIKLYYQVNPNEVIPPPPSATSRKDAWVKAIQASISSAAKPKVVQVTYELFNPEIDKLLKFFNGPVVEYFVMQSAEITEGRVPSDLKKQYRELLLDDMLGYDLMLPGGKKTRRRKSTGDFATTQKWTDFLNTMEETHFHPNGFEFPESEDFWKLAEKIGYHQATEESIKQLQNRIGKKLST